MLLKTCPEEVRFLTGLRSSSDQQPKRKSDAGRRESNVCFLFRYRHGDFL
jgi:hypothetical protein